MVPDLRMEDRVNGGLLLLREGIAAYQLVGGVTAYQGDDG